MQVPTLGKHILLIQAVIWAGKHMALGPFSSTPTLFCALFTILINFNPSPCSPQVTSITASKHGTSLAVGFNINARARAELNLDHIICT